ncbi:MAG: hypothetical protein Q9160_004757 [Pyrenula sp. 1 TL-2023]
MTNLPAIPGIELARRTVINDQDPSLGYKDITYSQLENAVIHAVHRLSKTLPSTSRQFQPFAYAGPEDLQYPILGVATERMQKVMDRLAFSIREPKGSSSRPIDKVMYVVHQTTKPGNHDRYGYAARFKHSILEAPDLDELLQDTLADAFSCTKSWQDNLISSLDALLMLLERRPSKAIDLYIRITATMDTAAGLENIDETQIHHCARKG